MPPGEEPLLDALERWARSTTGVVVPREAWDWSKVPAHLQPTYRVRRRRRRRAGPRQGPRRAQGAAARRSSTRRWRRSPATAGYGATGQTDVDVRRAASRDPAAPGRPRGARPTRPSLDEGETVGLRRVRLGGGGRRRGTGSAYDGCCCSALPFAGRPDRAGSTTPSKLGLAGLAVPLGRRAARRRAAPRSLADVVDAHPPVRDAGGVRRAGGGRRATRWPSAPARCSHDVLRVLADWRETDTAAQRPRRAGHAAGPAGHARAAGAAGAPRLRRRGRGRPAAPLPDVPRGDPAPPRAARRRRSPATGS